MMLNRAALIHRLQSEFPQLAEVAEAVYRFERRHRDVPVAVFYLDLSDRLPAVKEFADYQDQVIGKYYFEGEKSLQWNNYLYFIMSPQNLVTPEVRAARAWIEGDRRYARKFIISVDEIDAILNSAVFTPKDVLQPASVLSIWTEKLEAAGIYDAVVSDAGLPSRIQWIEDSSAPVRTTARIQSHAADLKPASFIRALKLTDYRPFPCQRTFEFGTVNLFVGANGSGKTSLLEALELLYCGKNKRNFDSSPAYRISAHFEDGSSEEATHSRELQVYRDRNLAWYGVAEIRTANLFQSFSRYNFLNTDAAVSLADTAGKLKEDLSKLLVGPDASKTWREIERMYQAVADRLRIRQQRQGQIQTELTSLKSRLEQVAQITPQSDALKTKLTEMLKRLGWEFGQQDRESVSAILVQELAALLSIAQQVTGLTWVGSPVTSTSISDYIRSTESILSTVEPVIVLLERQRLTENATVEEIVRTEQAKRITQRILNLCDAGVIERANEYSSLQELRHSYAGILADHKEDLLRRLQSDILDSTISEARDQVAKVRLDVEAGLSEAKDELREFSRLRDESVRLGQELRAVANRILQKSPSPDECPLCHTKFEPGRLATRMMVGLDEGLESIGQRLFEEVRKKDAELAEAVATETAVSWLWRFCKAASLPLASTIRSAISEVRQTHEKLGKVVVRLNALESEQRDLDAQGISKRHLDESVEQLRSMGFPLAEPFTGSARKLQSAIEDMAATLSQKLLGVRKEISRSENQLRNSLTIPEVGTQALQRLLAITKERVSISATLHAKLQNATKPFPWPANRPISELTVEAESVRRVATDLRVALDQERMRLSSFGDWTKRKEDLEAEEIQLNAQLQHLASAQSTLTSLIEEHSLTRGVETALQQNQAAIEAIFARIHSPAEFRGLGPTWDTLVRKADESEAELTEISTGQRAAFALSVFLAQNAKLPPGAPPVILIDDPIAHIDDLNSLSFLDYLRELVLKGNRQVFFATANDKIAALFRRKFDFLGDEFRKFDLTREEG